MTIQKTGDALLPLHSGRAPRWLFTRMVSLGREITRIIVDEHGPDEFLSRISDPFFFQSLGCVLGFDWHSSGVTTTVCGALKQALDRDLARETGICIAGGKRQSRNTVDEIEKKADILGITSSRIDRLKYSSRTAAKVDSAVVQDGFLLYHHCMFFTEKAGWAVVQQGMNTASGYARRYHWLSTNLKSFVSEPHNAVCCDSTGHTLDLTSRSNKETRESSVDLVNDGISHLKKHFQDFPLMKNKKKFCNQKTLAEFLGTNCNTLSLPKNHLIPRMSRMNIKTLEMASEIRPENYEELISIKGMGPKTLRALALVSNLVYGSPVEWKDPRNYSFAFGGKDNVPYPVDRRLMDQSTAILRDAVDSAKINKKEKLRAIRRLKEFYPV